MTRYVVDLSNYFSSESRTGIENVSRDLVSALQKRGTVILVKFQDRQYIEKEMPPAEDFSHRDVVMKSYNRKLLVIELLKYKMPSILRYALGVFRFKTSKVPPWLKNERSIKLTKNDILVLPEVILNRHHLRFIEGLLLSNIESIAIVHDIIPLESQDHAPVEISYAFKKYIGVVANAKRIFTPSLTTKNKLEIYLESLQLFDGKHIDCFEPNSRHFETPTRSCIKFDSDGISIIYVSSFIRRKNHIATIKSLAKVSSQFGVKVHLNLVGGSGNMFNLIQWFGTKNRNELFDFTIYRNLPECCLSALYSCSNLAIYFSKSEGFGIPVVDAANLGLDVLCLDLPIFRELALKYPIHLIADLTPERIIWVLNSLETQKRTERAPRSEPQNHWESVGF